MEEGPSFNCNGVLIVGDPEFVISISSSSLFVPLSFTCRKLDNCAKGKWVTWICRDKQYPDRNSRFYAAHEATKNEFEKEGDNSHAFSFNEVGTIEVDSGRAGVFDKQAIEDKNEEDIGVDCNSGFGDGSYTVFVSEKDKVVVTIVIQFITDVEIQLWQSLEKQSQQLEKIVDSEEVNE